MSNPPDIQTPKPADLPVNPPAQASGTQPAPTFAKPKTESSVRDARLKAALKANMARRKGQARARAGDDASATDAEAMDTKNNE